ncbi:MAG: PAS domain S-box protein [Planctomycetes bacterium]|nr:PAS domain S-box protein [Planctomycetota bacterium]MBL7037892.1 PAS domain S-box protein [Pirellulaceae bacterium]
MAQDDTVAVTELFHQLFQHSPDGNVVVDHAGRIVLVNTRVEEMFDYTSEELIGQPVEILVPMPLRRRHRENVKAFCDRPRVSPMGTNGRFSARRKDGSEFSVEISLAPVQTKRGLLVFSSVRDVTEHRRLEERLRHAQKMEAVGQLAAGVAHEFNNLLFGILGNAELILATQQGELPEHFDRPLRDIMKCGRHGAALTRQLLSFARKKKPEVSQFDINQVVSDLDGVLRQVAGDTITLEIDLASDLPPIEADEGEIEQALLNLAQNARDAMADGGVLTIQTAAAQLDEPRVSAFPHARPGSYVQLSVADTGCGMAPETMERIFEPFFTTKPVGKGTGLGLSTVFADVTEYGGIIEVESRQGDRTVFHIYLPAAGETVDAASDDVERPADQVPGGTETILVCDDDEVVLDSAAFLLETRGYSVIRALGASKALEAAQSYTGTIELLLTDVTMPEMDGWQLAQKLTAQRLDMKVIFMSGYAEDVLEAGAAEGEHIEFIQKPPETETLFRRIREMLDAPKMPAP